MEIILSLVIAAFLGLIPASIAKNKGHSFGAWWFYGWMLFIVAIIHVCFIPNRNEPQQSARPTYTPVMPAAGRSSADEILKFKELRDSGVITEEEFERKKQQLLNQI